jgi:hypothetical protein
METLIVHPKNKEQLAALKAFIKALKIDFTTEKNTYNPEFVEKVLKGVNARKAGKPGHKIDVDTMWK